MNNTLFKIYDIIYHHKHGKGIVVQDSSEPWMKNKITVKFDRISHYIEINIEYISFTQYSLEKGGFSQDIKDRTCDSNSTLVFI